MFWHHGQIIAVEDRIPDIRYEDLRDHPFRVHIAMVSGVDPTTGDLREVILPGPAVEHAWDGRWRKLVTIPEEHQVAVRRVWESARAGACWLEWCDLQAVIVAANE